MRKWLAAIGTFVLAILVLFYWGRSKILESYSAFPITPSGYYSLDGLDRKWIIQTVQPTVVGYKSFEGKNYIVGIYPDENSWKKVMILVSGDIGGSSVENIAVVGRGNNFEKVNFTDLWKKVPLGFRVRVEYFAQVPPAEVVVDENFCVDYRPACEYMKVDEETLSSELSGFGSMAVYRGYMLYTTLTKGQQ